MAAAPALLETQRRFMAALYDDADAGPIDAIAGSGLEPSARLRIYRRSCEAIQTGALRATYPAVLALVGEDFFDQSAHGYRRAHPSASGNLHGFGADFADYLASLPALAGYPYLPDVARLEWRRQLAALAGERAPLSADALARQWAGSDRPLAATLHPSVRVLASRYPVLTIWRYATQPSAEPLRLDGGGENVVLWREDGEVAMATPDAASFACIEALAQGRALDAAQAAALAADPDFEFAACMKSFAQCNLIVALQPVARNEETPA
jgi:hypothetical protein